MLKSSFGVPGAGATSTRGSHVTCSSCLVGVGERGLCRAVRDLISGERSCVDPAATRIAKRSRSGLKAGSIIPCSQESCTVDRSAALSAMIARVDDAIEGIKPLVNDVEFRRWIDRQRVGQVTVRLSMLAELRAKLLTDLTG